MSRRSRNKIKADFSMSSMTDIVFLLLIFFMLVSTLVGQNVLEVLSKSASKDQKQSSNIEVHINKEIEFYYINEDNKKIPVKNITELENGIKKILSNSENPGITLYADNTVPIQHVVKIMDIAYINKYKFEIAVEEWKKKEKRKL